MPALTADQIVNRVMVNCQLFEWEAPFRKGFTDDEDTEPLTAVLDYVNEEYRKMIRLGVFQCYKNYTMTVGVREFRADGTHLDIHDAKLLEPTTNYPWPLEKTTREKIDDDNPNYLRRTNGRPLAIASVGTIIMLDRSPDKAYTLRLFCDTSPDNMVLKADTPSRLDTALHDYLVDLASWRFANVAPRLTMTDTNDPRVLRYKFLSSKAKEARDYIAEVNNGRIRNTPRRPRYRNGWRQR